MGRVEDSAPERGNGKVSARPMSEVELELLFRDGAAPLFRGMLLGQPESGVFVETPGGIQSLKGPEDHFAKTGFLGKLDCPAKELSSQSESLEIGTYDEPAQTRPHLQRQVARRRLRNRQNVR